MRFLFTAALFALLTGCLEPSPDSITGSPMTPFEAPTGFPRPSIFLQPDDQTPIHFYIDFDSTHPPSSLALDNLDRELQRVVGRPAEIHLREVDLPSQEWRGGDLIDQFERWKDETGTAYSGSMMYVLYAPGSSEQGMFQFGRTLASLIIVFPDSIDMGVPRLNALDPVTSLNRDFLERTVLTHEMGHALGLVNYGVPMQQPHNDPDSPEHSANHESVMRNGLSTLQGWQELIQDNDAAPYRFDADDVADIRAYQATLAR